MRARKLILITLLILATVPALAQPRARRVVVTHGSHGGQPSPFSLVVEGAAVLPQGDLGDDFIGTDKGLGAGTGFELGGRLRYRVTPQTSVGPAVHWADFGDWDDVFDDGVDLVPYYVRTSVLRVGLDLQQFFGQPDARLRPYLTAGVALYHNRYEDWVEGEGVFTTSSNNLGLAAGVGVATGPVELSAVWNYNPVKNRQLPGGAGSTDDSFDWSYVAIRAGLVFGG
ncbi:MAG: hypothetical protein R3D98_03080 [Candidatus Krumholzibacteriia bacterium]